MKYFFYFFYFSLIVFSLFFFVGCNGVDDSYVDEVYNGKVIIGIPGAPPSAPVLYMVEQTMSSYDYEFYVYKSVDEANALLAREELHFVILPLNVISKLYNKIGSVQLLNVNTFGILYLVSLDSDVSGFSDLSSKELYVGGQGSSPDVLSRFFISRSGLDSDVLINYGTSSDIAQLMVAGRVRNAVLPEPILSGVLSNNEDVRIVADFYELWQDEFGDDAVMTQTGFAVLSDFAKKYPNVVSDFQTNYKNAVSDVVIDPSLVSDLVQSEFGIKSSLFVRAMDRIRIGFMDSDEAKKDVLDYLNVLYKLNPDMVGGEIPNDEFFY
jgi:NitT/TauT family transport system substrate-binding protein